MIPRLRRKQQKRLACEIHIVTVQAFLIGGSVFNDGPPARNVLDEIDVLSDRVPEGLGFLSGNSKRLKSFGDLS